MFKTAVDPQKFELFLEINELLNSSFSNLDSLFTTILESATRLTNAEAASLLLLNPETRGLEFVVALGTKGNEVKAFSLKKGEGIAGWVAENNSALIVNDVQTDSRFHAEISKNIGFPTHSILAVPLRVKGVCVGSIELINKNDGTYFSLEDQTWVEVFANQAGLAFQNAKSYRAMKAELDQLRDFVDYRSHDVVFITQNKTMIEILNLCRKFSSTGSNILIRGESGTGKELLADYIHAHSLRSKGPLVKVNCAALPEGLLESELFGHVKGAFTDAMMNRVGKFEAAQGGTIFLDEIAELSPLLQAKLLRVLETKKMERLGSEKTIILDVRVLSATSRDIQKEIEANRFRRDLYYRLNVLPVTLPPLRERREDVQLLAEYFIKEIAKRLRRPVRKLSYDAMVHLKSREWHGNVRELHNVLERAIVISEDGEITEKELQSGNLRNAEMKKTVDLRTAVQEFKKDFIQQILKNEDWNQTRAARSLRIQRTYLSKLLKEFGLDHQE